MTSCIHMHNNSDRLPQDRQVPGTGHLGQVHCVGADSSSRPARQVRCLDRYTLAELSFRRLTQCTFLGGHPMCNRHSTVPALSSQADGSKSVPMFAATARGATHSATARKLQAGQFLTQLHHGSTPNSTIQQYSKQC